METNNWKWFRYSDIFNIEKGKRLTKADMKKGNINFIGATDSNNGVTNKIGNDEYCFTGNKITVSYNGSIARAFYQKNAFWASDDVNVLSLKEYELNKNIAMFLLVLIEKEKYRYNYGRKWDKELMLDSKILLPQKCGLPDWGYMDSYIQSIIKHSHLKYKELWDGCLDKSPLYKHNVELTVAKWKWFRFDEIFDIRKGFYNTCWRN